MEGSPEKGTAAHCGILASRIQSRTRLSDLHAICLSGRRLPWARSAEGAVCSPQSSQLSPLLTILWNIPAINHPLPAPVLNVLPQLFLLTLTPGSPGNCEAQRMAWWQGPWPGDQVVPIPNHR